MRSILLSFLLAFTLAGGVRAGEIPDPLGAWRLVDYGAANPVLHCMPLGACLVALEEGETLQGRFLPDSARWQVEPGTTGPGQSIPVLVIKPKECGIATNLFVTTDRRVYTFLLQAPDCDPARLSAETIKFDQIRFNYPREFAALWGGSAPAAPAPPAGIATVASRIDQLSFNYSWSAGRKGLKPRTVYDDGSRTYIVLRDEDRSREAPAVFLHGEGGKLEAVNFSAPPSGGATYTVDRVAPELVLVTGPGDHQRTVIRRKGR